MWLRRWEVLVRRFDDDGIHVRSNNIINTCYAGILCQRGIYKYRKNKSRTHIIRFRSWKILLCSSLIASFFFWIAWKSFEDINSVVGLSMLRSLNRKLWRKWRWFPLNKIEVKQRCMKIEWKSSDIKLKFPLPNFYENTSPFFLFWRSQNEHQRWCWRSF